MKKDPTKFTEVELEKRFQPPPGIVHVMASRPVAVFGEIQGVECLLGTGTDVHVRLRGCDVIWVETQSDETARAFVYNPAALPILPSGEVFTSVDRQPLVSGHVAELQAQMRRFKLEQRHVIDEGKRAIEETKRQLREEARVLREEEGEETPPPANDDEEPENDPQTDQEEDQ